MRPPLRDLRRLASEQKAATSVEYCLIISMIVLAMLANQAVAVLSRRLSGWRS